MNFSAKGSCIERRIARDNVVGIKKVGHDRVDIVVRGEVIPESVTNLLRDRRLGGLHFRLSNNNEREDDSEDENGGSDEELPTSRHTICS